MTLGTLTKSFKTHISKIQLININLKNFLKKYLYKKKKKKGKKDQKKFHRGNIISYNNRSFVTFNNHLPPLTYTVIVYIILTLNLMLLIFQYVPSYYAFFIIHVWNYKWTEYAE